MLRLAPWELLTDSKTFLAAARSGAGLPFPGNGATVDRFHVLRTTSACNPSVGRLLEAHCDAQAIFHEANVEIPENMAMAVWASSSLSRVAGTRTRSGLLLNGTQHFCGGAGVVDGALMTVSCDDGERLVFIRLNQIGIEVDFSKWKTSAFSEASVGTVRLSNVEIREADMVGDPYFYSARPGFWWGAVGVAACWAGISDRLIDLQRQRLTRCDEIASVQLGLQSALCWSINATLNYAGTLIDQPSSESARRLALSARHQVASAGAKILESIEHEAGPGPFAFDPEWVQVVTELRMALGQHHGDRDLGELGNLMLCS